MERPSEAATYFAASWHDPWAAERLGPIYERDRRTDQSAEAYALVATAWRDADPELQRAHAPARRSNDSTGRPRRASGTAGSRNRFEIAFFGDASGYSPGPARDRPDIRVVCRVTRTRLQSCAASAEGSQLACDVLFVVLVERRDRGGFAAFPSQPEPSAIGRSAPPAAAGSRSARTASIQPNITSRSRTGTCPPRARRRAPQCAGRSILSNSAVMLRHLDWRVGPADIEEARDLLGGSTIPDVVASPFWVRKPMTRSGKVRVKA